MGKTVGPLVESVSLLQKKQAALAIVEFREANGVGPDDALDLRRVEQLPVCSRTTFGGEPKVRLRFTKSLSLVRSVN